MSHARVRRLFAAALTSYASGKGYTVSHDNVKARFKGATHIRSHLIPVDTFSDTLSGDHNGFIGMYQMTVVTKFGTGVLDSELVLEELQQVFKNNRRFVDDTGFAVQVVSPIKSPEGKQIEGEWVVPCYFNYRSDTN